MKILLDTCAFLWLTTDAPELSDNARILYSEYRQCGLFEQRFSMGNYR